MGNFAVFRTKKTPIPPWSMGNRRGQHPTGNGYMPGYVTPINWWVHSEPGGWHDSYVGKPLPPPTVAWESDILRAKFNDSFLLKLMTAESLGITGTLGAPAANPGPYDPSAMPQTGGVNGTGPYVQEFSLTPPQAHQLYLEDASFAEIIIDLFTEGVGMGTSSVAPYGTPGQLIGGPGGASTGPGWEYHFGARFNPDGTLFQPGIFGHGAGGKVMVNTGINPKFLNVKPPKKKKTKKAWWLNPTGQ